MNAPPPKTAAPPGPGEEGGDTEFKGVHNGSLDKPLSPEVQDILAHAQQREDERFDWQHDETVVVPEQEAMAVYPNPKGEVVIRRQARWDDNDDPFFILQPRHAVQFAQAVLDAAGVSAWVTTDRMAAMMAARPDIDWQAVLEDFREAETVSQTASERLPKDPTAAERQRRRRRKQRDADRDTVTVTPNGHDRPDLLEQMGA